MTAITFDTPSHVSHLSLVVVFPIVNAFFIFLQNKPVMAFGLVTISLCVGYIGYLHATKENDQELYEAVDSEGERYMRRKTSKWD